jgi:hypothetical protein
MNKNPEFAKAQKTCGVEPIIDEYYSSNDFIERFQKNLDKSKSYNLVIFSDTSTEAIRKQLSPTNKHATKKAIMKRAFIEFFKARKFSHNIRPFQISLTCFLYNTNKIQLNATDSLKAVFEKTQNKIFALVDDFAEAATLFRKWHCENKLNKFLRVALEIQTPSQSL